MKGCIYGTAYTQAKLRGCLHDLALPGCNEASDRFDAVLQLEKVAVNALHNTKRQLHQLEQFRQTLRSYEYDGSA